ncbi:hypothetical protein FSP39_006172 [Pinctada imbricata]|uniref:thiopurine S-methyltransferase n=1 Tax=Pinctada imbricata TaxID=66713 RepID=A0AA89C6Q9_PINIB|nr:hypothetical protein FSP39_006172 [Pinctada imbricata]
MESNVPEIKEFWSTGWENDFTPYHKAELNTSYHKHVKWLLSDDQKSRVFFPFCGKCVDMKWMYDEGHEVIGIEGVELPIIEFFKESQIEYEVLDVQGGTLKVYQSKDGRLKLYYGNYYDMRSTGEDPFTAVWDRGALEAIPASERQLYVQLMMSLMSPGSRCLVEVAERSDDLGPPYFISPEELTALYGADYSVIFLESYQEEKQPPTVKHFNMYSVQKS